MTIYLLLGICRKELKDIENRMEDIGGILPVCQAHFLRKLPQKIFQSWWILAKFIDTEIFKKLRNIFRTLKLNVEFAEFDECKDKLRDIVVADLRFDDLPNLPEEHRISLDLVVDPEPMHKPLHKLLLGKCLRNIPKQIYAGRYLHCEVLAQLL